MGHKGLVTLLLAVHGLGCNSEPAVRVRPGLEVLVEDSLQMVLGKRVGLLTNQSGVDRHGRSGIDLLVAHGVNLVAIFAPEHGFRGAAPPGAPVASSVDSATGLPIYSLYGPATDTALTHLGDIDLLLVDLQDVGARYFTWLHTVVTVMETAANGQPEVLILDRPNPIGAMVQGNVLDTAFRSPVGRIAIPMRHGMTLGELARLAQAELHLGATLRVLPVAGWDRDRPYDETGLPFHPPSPNLTEIEALFHYPGLCLFEGTALSVGRGTDAPFMQIGAPWLDTAQVLAAFRADPPEGVELRGVVFTPRSPGDGKLADTLLRGVRLHLTDRRRYDPTVVAGRLLQAVQTIHGSLIGWNPAHFDRLAGGPDLRQAIVQRGLGPELLARWRNQRDGFIRRSKPYLLYSEVVGLP